MGATNCNTYLAATAAISASRPVNQPVLVQSKRSGTISEYLAVSLSIRQDSNLQTVSLSACPSDSVAELCLAILPLRDLAQDKV